MKTFNLFGIIGVLLGASFAASAADSWSYPVREITPLRDKGSTQVTLPEESTYTSLALDGVKKHRMCLLMPQTQDSVFMAYIYGAVDEATRMGQAITVFDAGGYGNDSTQRAQFENCMTLGAEAILLEPINPGGWEVDLANARAAGVKIINVTEAVDARVDSRVLVDFRVNGRLLGEMLARQYPQNAKPVEILVLPGAAGIPFVEDTVQGLRDGLQGSSVKIDDVIYGGMDAAAQLKLVEDALVAYPDIQYIVGNGIAIKQAVSVLAQRGLEDKVKLLSTYLDPDLLAYIKAGKVQASAAESSVLLKRIAVNLAVAAIEAREPGRDLIPQVQLVTRENAGDRALVDANFPPAGWKPVFKVN